MKYWRTAHLCRWRTPKYWVHTHKNGPPCRMTPVMKFAAQRGAGAPHGGGPSQLLSTCPSKFRRAGVRAGTPEGCRRDSVPRPFSAPKERARIRGSAVVVQQRNLLSLLGEGPALAGPPQWSRWTVSALDPAMIARVHGARVRRAELSGHFSGRTPSRCLLWARGREATGVGRQDAAAGDGGGTGRGDGNTGALERGNRRTYS